MPRLRVEVLYALATAQEPVILELPAGVSAGEAVVASGLPARHGLPTGSWHLGIGGRAVKPGHLLRDGRRGDLVVEAKNLRKGYGDRGADWSGGFR